MRRGQLVRRRAVAFFRVRIERIPVHAQIHRCDVPGIGLRLLCVQVVIQRQLHGRDGGRPCVSVVGDQTRKIHAAGRGVPAGFVIENDDFSIAFVDSIEFSRDAKLSE